jgi:hypothetical protein
VSRQRFLGEPPRTLRKVRLDNIAIVPASLLPYKDQWQQIANALPDGDVLIYLPPTEKPQRLILERTASGLRAKGWRVTTIAAAKFPYR